MAFFGSSWKDDENIYSGQEKKAKEVPCEDHFVHGWNSAINHVIAYLSDKRGFVHNEKKIKDIKKFLK